MKKLLLGVTIGTAMLLNVLVAVITPDAFWAVIGGILIGFCAYLGGEVLLFKKGAWFRGFGRRAGPSGVRRAEKAFALLEAIFPKRICNEEIGDAMEVIHKLVAAKHPKWMIYAKVASTFFWVSTHAVLDYIITVAGAVKAVAGKGDGHDEK
jgi:hypothetical protein